MSKAKRPKDLLERMKQVATRRAPGEEGQAAAPPPPAEAQEPAEKKVRITVDLDPEMHRFLKIYALERGMKMSEVVRELIEELRTGRWES